MRHVFKTIGVTAILFLAYPVSADNVRLSAAAGVFDFINSTSTAGGVAFEVRGPIALPSWSSETFLGFAPALGVLANTDEGGLVYAIVTLPFVAQDPRYEFTFSAGVAAYEQGNSRLDLGGTAQFILGATASRALSSGHRVGLAVR